MDSTVYKMFMVPPSEKMLYGLYAAYIYMILSLLQ
jgi:hypothetical protein